MNFFFSYDWRDHAWTEKLFKYLKNNDTANTYHFDRSEVKAGDNVIDWMNSQIQQADGFIVIISHFYINNVRFANKEYEKILYHHLDYGKRIVPVFIDEIRLSDAPLGIPGLRSIRSRNHQEILSELQIIARPPQYFPENSSVYIPEERRIRVQLTNSCTQSCPWCHNEQIIATNEIASSEYSSQLKELLQNIIRNYSTDDSRPRPLPDFSFTGGEPLVDQRRFVEFLNGFDSATLKKSYLLTNARNLDQNTRDELLRMGLHHLRVSYYGKNGNDEIRIPETEGRDAYFQAIHDNIAASIKSNFEVRINHVLTQEDQVAEIENFLNSLAEDFPEKPIPVAFIQKYEPKKGAQDIFKVGQNWAKENLEGWPEHVHGTRSVSIQSSKGRLISFIKVNCDHEKKADERLVGCLRCILDRDLTLTSNGMICVCSTWTGDNDTPQRFFHLDERNPLPGLAASIRKQYASVGFYRHFERLAEDKTYTEDSGNISAAIVERVLRSNPLFEERFANAEDGTEQERFCEKLLGLAYSASGCATSGAPGKQFNFVCAILCVIHLCVDEGLFTTGRTIMIQGLVESLLNWSLSLMHKEANKELFIEIALCCIATIGYENCSGDSTNNFLKRYIGESNPKFPFFYYLRGCIERQKAETFSASNEADKANSALSLCVGFFEQSIEIANNNLKQVIHPDFLVRLNKEILVEALRSKGAALKDLPEKRNEAIEALQKASFLGSLHETKLRYAALYSDGYYEMKRYFESMGKDINSAYNAHHKMQESLSVRPNFYASNIRIGILELALGYTSRALERGKSARTIFLGMGILGDLEYVNYWLNEIMIGCAVSILESRGQGKPLTPSRYSRAIMGTCEKIGAKDVRCAYNDAKYIQWILEQSELRSQSLLDYINDCSEILQNKGGCTK